MAPSIPFQEPPYLNNLSSPYYNDSHRKWQKTCRQFVTEVLNKVEPGWDETADGPGMLYKKFGEAGFLLAKLPGPLPVKWLKAHGIHELAGGLKVEEYDQFHFLIFIDEMTLGGTTGPGGSITDGFSYGVPPLFNYGSKELQERFIPDLIAGRKITCIAITEPG